MLIDRGLYLLLISNLHPKKIYLKDFIYYCHVQKTGFFGKKTQYFHFALILNMDLHDIEMSFETELSNIQDILNQINSIQKNNNEFTLKQRIKIIYNPKIENLCLMLRN